MGEISLLLKITPRAIRFYEEIGLIAPAALRPTRGCSTKRRGAGSPGSPGCAPRA